MAVRGYNLDRTGDSVKASLDKINALGPATQRIDGLLTAIDKKKLDGLGIKTGTTAYWNAQRGYVPAEGEIIIYSDYKTIEVDGRNVNVPGIKIGSGNGYVQDLVFTDAESAGLLADHIADAIAHIQEGERDFWNNKLNVTDTQEVVVETLIFNRN